LKLFAGTASEWDACIAQLPGSHLLQTWEWAQVKAKYGWEPAAYTWESKTAMTVPAAAMILTKKIRVGGFAARLNLLYCPRGPLMDWSNEHTRTQVLDDLEAFAKKHSAIFLKFDPDVALGTGLPGAKDFSPQGTGQAVASELVRRAWKYSSGQVQFKNTLLVDLTPPEADLLARMKQKTRYNIRLAEKKGVTVRSGTLEDLRSLYRMYAGTSIRDGFTIREEEYYLTVWETFMFPAPSGGPRPACEPLIAEVEGSPVAAIFVFYFAGRAYYLYGMSGAEHREKMPNYLLQWEAIRRAKARGCHVYDLWGAPDEFDENDRLWGVFRFKEGLGGYAVSTLGAWDYVPNQFWYRMYSEIIPRVLSVMRARGRASTRLATTERTL